MSIPISSNFNLAAQLPLDARTVVTDITARDLIPSIQRYEGMIVYVTDINTNYQLQGGVTNVDWVVFGVATTTASNGLNKVVNDIKLGGSLTGATSINLGAHNMYIPGTNTGEMWYMANNGIGSALGLIALSGIPLNTYGLANYGINIVNNSTGTNTIKPTAKIFAYPNSGTVSNGFGSSLDFTLQSTTIERLSNQLISKWTNSTDLSRTSEFSITGVNNAVESTLFTLKGTGQPQFNKLGTGAFTGTAAYNLATDSSGNIIEVAGGGGTTETASNGLTKVGNDIQLGGTLTNDIVIGTNTKTLTINTTDNQTPLIVNSTIQTAIRAYSSLGSAIRAEGAGLGLFAKGALAASFFTYDDDLNNVKPTISLYRTAGTAGDGIGQSIEYRTQIAGGSIEMSNTLVSKWTNATSRTSEFSITGVNNAVTSTLFTLAGSGATKLNKYGVGTFTGTPAYNLATDSSGNIIESPFNIISNSFSQVVTATTTFTVTIGSTQPNNTYKVVVTPTSALSAALFYVTNKTTTTFDVMYLAGLTGTVTFDWILTL